MSINDSLAAENARLRRELAVSQQLLRERFKAVDADRATEANNHLRAQLRRLKTQVAELKEQVKEGLLAKMNLEMERELLAEELGLSPANSSPRSNGTPSGSTLIRSIPP